MVETVRGVQVRPSGETRRVADSPTAMNWPVTKATLVSQRVVSEVRGVQGRPSGEVRMVPPSPTATKSCVEAVGVTTRPEVTLQRFCAVGAGMGVHVCWARSGGVGERKARCHDGVWSVHRAGVK